MFSITYRGLEGQPGLYARIQRKIDALWWDAIAKAWIAAPTANCNIALAEDANKDGVYTATDNNLLPKQGGIYRIHVYEAANAFICSSEAVNSSNRMSVLEIINEVQRQLRLPQSASMVDAHAQLLLSFMNKVMLNFMMEAAVFDDLKVNGSIQLQKDISIYAISPLNVSNIDVLQNIQIGTSAPLEKLSDDDFRDFVRVHTEEASDNTLTPLEAEPEAYRQYARAGGAIYIEVCPTPDQSYTADYALLVKPERVADGNDIPMLDQETIIEGVLLLAKEEMGIADQGDVDSFAVKLKGEIFSQGESNWGDVNPL